MKHTMIIYDKDRRYADKAAGYINSKAGFPFEARVPADMDEAFPGSRGMNIDLILIDEDLYKGTREYAKGAEIILLSGDSLKTDGNRQVIYKYQSIEGIIKEILRYASSMETLKNLITRKNRMKIIGLYSPVRRSGQTSLGLALGQILAKTYRTIFVSMDCFGSVPKEVLNVPYSGDLSDLLYSMNNDVRDVASLIGGASGCLGSLDVMPPMERQNDLISISFAQWSNLLRYLEQGTDYEYVILDMSDAVQGLTELTALCNRLITTMVDEKSDRYRLESFKKELEGIEEIKDSISYIYVPVSEDNKTGHIMTGSNTELYECARELIKEIVA